MTNIKVIPSVALGSDHMLLVAEVRRRKLWRKGCKQERWIRVWKLKKEEVREKFKEGIVKMVPKEEVEGVEEEWRRFKEGIVKVVEETWENKWKKEVERNTMVK